jgi:hypothetical protein
MANAKDEKNAGLYRCDFCDFECCKHSNYSKHLLTPKHQKRICSKQMETLETEKMPLGKYVCVCKNVYTSRSGLWKHNKKCQIAEKMPKNAEKMPKSYISDKELILELLKQNQEFKEQIMELVKKDNICTTNNINNTINNNQNFNLNLFLNEQCKDALDIMEFIGSLNVQLSDLENTGKVGYVKGVSDIFLRNLKELDVHKRPIHCSDIKREVMYVKDKDVWEKDEDKKKITLAIRHIADKNFKQIHQWLQENPEAKDARNKKNEQYMTIVNKCTGGINEEEDQKYYGKIITTVAKEVQIQK